MADIIRLSKVLRELNISMDRAIDFLESKNIEIEKRPTTKISAEVYELLSGEFQTDASKKVASKEVGQAKQKEKEALRQQRELEEARKKEEEATKVIKAKTTFQGPKKVGKIELNPAKPKVKEEKPADTSKKSDDQPSKKITSEAETQENESITKTPEADNSNVKTQYAKLSGPKSTGQTIDLSQFDKPKKSSTAKGSNVTESSSESKKKRRRISKIGGPNQEQKSRSNKGRNPSKPLIQKVEPTAEEVQKQVRETLEKLQGKTSKGKGAKYRRDKRDQHRQQTEKDLEQQALESKILKVTEFVTANEVATMMDVSVTEIISACMSLGMMVTMNQRLDAETLSIVAEEFGYKVDFVTADIDENIEEVEDNEEDLQQRAPIVTVMGHVDHGKTSLLDYIREENVIAGESGGITQHIGAYGVTLASGQKIAFLDTPGHEAFTAMRARGAQVTDIAIIVIAADDAVMPQTKEAVQHSRAAGVPLIIAVNKMDKEAADPDRVKTELSQLEVISEEWGGEHQFCNVSAKTGMGVDELLEAIVLQAEVLDLKAVAEGPGRGIVIESRLDKGRGPVASVLVQEGQQGLMETGQEVPYLFNQDGNPIREWKQAVLGLTVTPRVLAEEQVELDLAVVQDSIGELLANGELALNTHRLQTKVRMDMGQTLVLGGALYEQQLQRLLYNPKWLSVPIFNRWLQQQKKQSQRFELLVFVTPKLIS